MNVSNADHAPSELLPSDVIARQGVHAYVSTACHHGLHPRCCKNCKFCAAPCACYCHALTKDAAK